MGREETDGNFEKETILHVDLKSPGRSPACSLLATLLQEGSSALPCVLGTAFNKYLRKEWVEKHMQGDTKATFV